MLFPKKLAVELTPSEEKKYLEKIKREDNHIRSLIEDRHKIAESLNNKTLDFTLKS
jgi:ribosomal protein L9